ncbi:MAG: hypothetical protein Q7T11_09655, partial [Deltaproteobacteria bacterium]|nr:hypothetical protein [Deltaproteobacteria bacterium]
YSAEKEHILIEGIPVQFIPVYNSLVEEAVHQASVKEYEGVPIKVLTLEYLLAIMVDTNRPKDRGRISQLIGAIDFDEKKLATLLEKYSLKEKWERYIEKK